MSELSRANDYVLLLQARTAGAERAAGRVKAALALHRPDLTLCWRDESVALYCGPRSGWQLLRTQNRLPSILVGRSFGLASSPRPGSPRSLEARDLPQLASGLLRETWGAYVALLRSDEGAAAALRDPSGALGAFATFGEHATVISSFAPRWLVEAVRNKAGVEPTSLAHALADPTQVTFRSLLKGVEIIPPGTLLSFTGERWSLAHSWRPAELAHRQLSLIDSASALRQTVGLVCRSLLPGPDPLLIELSGGLDSAIVLGALAAGRGGREIKCLNFATRFCEGEERAYARDAADLWRVPLVEAQADEEGLDLSLLERVDHGAEPYLYGLDFALDEMIGKIASAVGAGWIVTGQGGDAVFFQMPAIDIAVDAMRSEGLAALFTSLPFALARRTHCSVWRIWRRMLADRVAGTRAATERFSDALLGRTAIEISAAGLPRHPWLDDLEQLAPAKRIQLEALCNGQLFNGPLRRAAVAEVVHPLLAQPLVELCLAIPSHELAGGPLNRTLARDAFVHAIPNSIRRRSGKGEASNYFGRSVKANLGFLRRFLLDGALVERGLLDRRALDNLLTEPMLLQSRHARLPMVYASFEGWARHWSL